MGKEKKEIRQIDLKGIKNPSFLHELNYAELDKLASDIRGEIIDVTSKNGGHIASNLGSVEATIALCRSFDFNKDKIIFDVGHQSYTYKILTGRSLDKLRKKDGVSGFQKIDESPYDHFECGHSSTSISAALAMAYARDLDEKDYNVVAFIGDSSIINGLSLEAINHGGECRNKIIIILNDNNMSISKPIGGFSKSLRKFSTSNFYINRKLSAKRILSKRRVGRKIYSLAARFKNFVRMKFMSKGIVDSLGYAVIGPVDGHDIKKLEKAFNKAKKITHSTIVHIKTVKGKGYEPAEKDQEGLWHGVSSFNKITGELPPTNLNSWSYLYSDLTLEAMRNHLDSITVVAATGVGSCLQEVHDEFPTRYIDVGIAEEHAFTFSSALSVSGKHPIIVMYSTFLQRGYDQISHDLARLNSNATILIDRAGLVGADGDTHQGIYDSAFLYSVPNTVIAMASRKEEAKALFDESYKNHGVFCIRFPKENVIKDDSGSGIEFGKWKWEIKNHNNTLLIATGPMTINLKNALIENDKKVDLINAIYQKPLDEQSLADALSYEKIIIYDCYGVKEGFASFVAARLSELGYKGKLIIKAIPLEFVKCATIDEQRKSFGLAVEDILNII